VPTGSARHISVVSHATAAAAPAPALSFWRLNLAGWTAYMIAMALSRIGRFPFAYMVATKTMLATVGLLLTGFFLRPLYRRALGADPSLRRVIMLTVTASYAAAMLWTLADNTLDVFIVRALLTPRARFPNASQLFGGTLYNAYTLLAWSLLYVGIKHQQALHAERERSLRAEALAHKARLEALRWQLNPHFLFNALNAISTLVIDGRSHDAATMIARLGDLLRSTLEVPSEAEIPLASELELVQRYLDIEQVRLGDRLSLQIDVDPDVRRARVPSLLLQPIVENAIRHAIAPRTRGGRLALSARRAGNRLHLAVEDDGPGLSQNGRSGSGSSGIGLDNTRERLRHLYGDAQHLMLDRGTLGGLRVRFDLPFHE
jgi:two-component system, LytTR family, sensor kinase